MVEMINSIGENSTINQTLKQMKNMVYYYYYYFYYYYYYYYHHHNYFVFI